MARPKWLPERRMATRPLECLNWPYITIEGNFQSRKLPTDSSNEAEKDLMVLVRREVQLLYFFCGTNSGFQYGNQIKDAFRAIDFRGRLQVCYLPEASHTFMFMKSRDQFIHLLGAWMKSCFGSAP